MNLVLSITGWLFIAAGLVFFISGSVGLLRFPDVFCRLHAVTKADTVGLGLVAAGLAFHAENLHTLLVLLFIWLLVMASGAVTCHLLARFERTTDSTSARPGDAVSASKPPPHEVDS